ncbi:MAG: hypothetical protein HYR92_00330 [Burkholderiales bacterium]|nr:hypothetical protein [Burkholderiales bacterium]
MKTKMKLALAMLVFGLVLAVFASFAIRAHGHAKLTIRDAASETQGLAQPSASASASASASTNVSASASVNASSTAALAASAASAPAK